MKEVICQLVAIVVLCLKWCGAEPHISASIYPQYTDRIQTDTTIVLDLRLSYDDDNLPLYFTIESFDTDGPPFLTVANSTETMHYFSLHSTGLKRIKITATNIVVGDRNLTASGRAAPFKLKAFYVKQKTEAFVYRSSVSAPVGNAEIVSVSYPSTATNVFVSLPIRVWDPESNSLEDAQFLTKQLAGYGQSPEVALSDPQFNVSNVQYNDTLMAWTAVISGPASISTIVVTITKSTSLGDPVRKTRISISLVPLIAPLWPEQSDVDIGGILRIQAPMSKGYQTICHPCSRLACVEFGPSHLVSTRDGFITSKNIGYLISGTILDVRFALNRLVIATNESLVSISLKYPNSINRLLSYNAIHATIGTLSQCPIPDGLKRTSSIFLSIWNGTISDFVHTYSCKGISCQDSNVNNSILATPLSLPNRNVTFTLIRTEGNLKSLITNSYTSISRNGFVFENFSYNASLPLITPFAYGHGLFVFIDDTLWIAHDDGQYFSKVSFRGPVPKSVQITTSSQSTAYVVKDLTNGIVYCGSTFSDLIVPCYTGNPQQSSNIHLWFDSSDSLHLTYTEAATARLHIYIPSSTYIDAYWIQRFTSVKFLPSATNALIVPIPGYAGLKSDPRYLLIDRRNASLQEWAYDIDMGYLEFSDTDPLTSMSTAQTSQALLAFSSQQTIKNRLKSHTLFKITNFDLSATAINSSAVVLQIASPSDHVDNSTNEGWLQAHLLCTVWIKDGVFLINRYINATQIGAVAVVPTSNMTRLSASAGDWRLWDSRPYRNDALVGQQSVALTSLSNSSYFRLTISPGSFTFRAGHIGRLVVLESLWGVITSQISSQTVECALGATSAQLQGNQTYQAGQWSMTELDFDADLTWMPHLSRVAKRSYAFVIPPCPYDDTDVIKPLPYQYLDNNESVNVSIFLPGSKPKPRVSLFGIQSSSAAASVQVDSYDSGLGSNGVNVSLTLTDVGSCDNCIATVIFGTKQSSAQCDRTSLPAFSHVVMGCPPGKSIALDWTQVNTNMVDLPVNYRPPSALGLGVPTSPNIYNANTNQSRTEFMKISQISGKYKNCTRLGTDSCICTTSGGVITPITQTDCIRRVTQAAYGDLFQVQILILDDGQVTATLSQPYQIIELNGRDDFCTSLSTTCLINTSPYIIDPSQNAGIRWSGEGLYHFRIVALQGSYCELTTEFLVFVTNPPLQTAVETFVIVMTAMVFGLSLLIGYVYKSSQLQRAVRHKAAFVLNKQYFTKLKAL